MRRCPECNSLFPDAERFCEVDGTPLVADPPSPSPNSVAPQPKSNEWLLPIGVLAGVVLGALLVLVYFVTSRQTAQENSNTSASSSSRQQVVAPLQPAPPATSSPLPEPSVEPSTSPSVETPSPENSSARVAVSSSNPISTAAKGSSDPVVIRLNSGLTIEADEAWQTAEGIWYRKHSVVSLLDPKNVKAIEKVSPAAPQPSVSPSP